MVRINCFHIDVFYCLFALTTCLRLKLTQCHNVTCHSKYFATDFNVPFECCNILLMHFTILFFAHPFACHSPASIVQCELFFLRCCCCWCAFNLIYSLFSAQRCESSTGWERIYYLAAINFTLIMFIAVVIKAKRNALILSHNSMMPFCVLGWCGRWLFESTVNTDDGNNLEKLQAIISFGMLTLKSHHPNQTSTNTQHTHCQNGEEK